MEKLRNNVQLFTSAGDPKYKLTQADGQPVRLEGYAIVWNVLSSDRGGYVVRLAPGSANVISPCLCLYAHDYDNPLGRNDDGSLQIASDDYGVKISLALPNSSIGRDLQSNVGSQLIRGMSFGMLLDGAEFEDTEEDTEQGKLNVRTFTKFFYDEVTITVIPAFEQTSIKVAETPAEPLVPDYTKELDEQRMKLDRYKLDQYSFTLAELQRVATDPKSRF